MNKALRALVAAGCLSAGAAAHAHHSFAVHFVADKIVSVSGVVTEFRFRNPHGLVFFTSAGEDGTEQAWKAETNSPNILRRRGWNEHSLEVGDRVTVTGYPARDGSNYLRIYKVKLADGHELVSQAPMPGVDDDKD
ncbi:MAG TPA: DUF6152 family protein [Gammaproteobacteria bacterium]|nr:DUF6152 family protein [Gammaproteobacteria bacterium]